MIPKIFSVLTTDGWVSIKQLCGTETLYTMTSDMKYLTTSEFDSIVESYETVVKVKNRNTNIRTYTTMNSNVTLSPKEDFDSCSSSPISNVYRNYARTPMYFLSCCPNMMLDYDLMFNSDIRKGAKERNTGRKYQTLSKSLSREYLLDWTREHGGLFALDDKMISELQIIALRAGYTSSVNRESPLGLKLELVDTNQRITDIVPLNSKIPLYECVTFMYNNNELSVIGRTQNGHVFITN